MYFSEDGDKITKYDVIINKEKLLNVRKKIIDNCSVILHIKGEFFKEPDYYDTDRYRNYKSQKIGMIRADRDSYDSRVMYLIEYDCYDYPMIVKHIDQLLSGNMSVVDEIKNYKDYNANNKYITAQIKKQLEDNKIYLEINPFEKSKANIESIKEEINKVTEYQERNKNQKSTDEYIVEILSCLTFIERDSYNKNNSDNKLVLFKKNMRKVDL